MKNCLRVLSQPIPSLAVEAELATDQQEREGALELLADLCENMDNAAGIPGPTHGCPSASSGSFFLLSPMSCCGSALVFSLGDHTIGLFPTLPASSLSLSCLASTQAPDGTVLSLPGWSLCHQEGTFTYPTSLAGIRSTFVTFSKTGHFSLVSWDCTVTA